jgi:hypothetical protein
MAPTIGRVPRTGAQRLGSASGRGVRAWRDLPPERRLAAVAALGLFVTLFLPWYQETVIASGLIRLQSSSASLTGWGAFSFVEAAVLLVAAGVLFLLFIRAEGKAFHVPGGDGGVITAAGIWTCLLILWRMFDKEGTTGHGQYATTWGIEWGIFVALAIAALLTYSGTRIRHAHEPEPPLPGDAPGPPAAQGDARRGRSRRDRPMPTFDVDDSWRAPSNQAATRVAGERPAAAAAAAAPRRVRPRSIGVSGEPIAAPTQPLPPQPQPSSGDEPQPSAGGVPRPSPGGGPRPSPGRTPRPVPGRAPRPSPPPAVDSAGSEDPTLPERPRRSRGLDVREIQELDIAEPPTARIGRSRPSRPRTDPTQSDDPEDHATLRLDRPS